MNTKLKGDIAEQFAVAKALQRGYGVLTPVGDRLPYDLVFEVYGRFYKIQVKNSWYDNKRQNFVVDNRRTNTNQRQMKRRHYSADDFDFALVFIEGKEVFYVFPVDVFLSYASEIHMVESAKRQRKPSSIQYRDAWSLIEQ